MIYSNTLFLDILDVPPKNDTNVSEISDLTNRTILLCPIHFAVSPLVYHELFEMKDCIFYFFVNLRGVASIKVIK